MPPKNPSTDRPTASTTEPSTAPWDKNSWHDIEEELASISPTVRVQWDAARAKVKMQKRQFVSKGRWKAQSTPPGFPPLQSRGNIAWTADGKPRVMRTQQGRWSPPAPQRDERIVTPWNVKAPRLSPRVAAAKFDFAVVGEGSEGSDTNSEAPHADDMVLEEKGPTEETHDAGLKEQKHTD